MAIIRMHGRVGRRLVAANIRTHGRGGRRSKNAAAAVVWTRALRTIAIGGSDQFTRALVRDEPQKAISGMAMPAQPVAFEHRARVTGALEKF